MLQVGLREMRGIAFALLLAVILSAPLSAQTLTVGQPTPGVCPVNPVLSYMDVLLDPHNTQATVFVYNISTNFVKNPVANGLIFRVDLTDAAHPTVCWTGTDAAGHANFTYDPNVEGCLDYWYIFCPQYHGSPGEPIASDKNMCLNGTGLPDGVITGTMQPCGGGSTPVDYSAIYLASHNELYFCNQVPKDFGPLCWPLMLIFGLLIGASFLLGRNPFMAFDMSSPRFNRGRQYTMRVQQHSFDLLGYAFAAQSAATTSGAIGGKVRLLLTGKGDLVDANGEKIGNLDKAGNIRDENSKIIGKMVDGKAIATESDGTVKTDGKGNRYMLGAGGSIAGAINDKNQLLKINEEGKVVDWTGKEATRPWKNEVIGTFDAEGKLKMASGETVRAADTRASDLGWGRFGPISGLTTLVGMAVTPLMKGIFPDEAGKKDLADADIQVDRRKPGPGGAVLVDARGNTVGESFAVNAEGQPEKGSFPLGKTPGIPDTNRPGGASETTSETIYRPFAVEKSNAQSASLFTATNIFALFRIFSDEPWSLDHLSKKDRDVMDGWEKKGNELTSADGKVIGVLSKDGKTVLNKGVTIGTYDSAKQAIVGNDRKVLGSGLALGKAVDKNGTGYSYFENWGRALSLVWATYSEKFEVTFLSERADATFWDHTKAAIRSIYKLYTTITEFSTYSKAFSKGVGFMENFNNKNTIMSFPGSNVSYGTFVSYFDPSFVGGAGLPYGLNVLEPLFSQVRDRADLMLASSPDATYAQGYAIRNGDGSVVMFMLNPNGTYSATDGAGAPISDYQLKNSKTIIQDEGTRNAIAEVVGKKGAPAKYGDMTTGQILKKIVSDNNPTLAPDEISKIIAPAYAKIGLDGKFSMVDASDYKAALARQENYVTARRQLLEDVNRFAPGMSMSLEDRNRIDKATEVLTSRRQDKSLDALAETLDAYGDLEGRQKGAIGKNIAADMLALHEAGTIELDSKALDRLQAVRDGKKESDGSPVELTRRDIYGSEGADRSTRAGILGQVNELHNLRETELEYKQAQMVGVQVQNLAREAETLHYVRENVGSESTAAEYAKYQTYAATELEARQAYSMLSEMGRNGPIGKAMEYMAESDAAARQKMKEDVASQFSEVSASVIRLPEGSAEYYAAVETGKQLNNTIHIMELVDKREAPENLSRELQEIAAVERANRVLVDRVENRISSMNSASELLYSSSKLGISPDAVLPVLKAVQDNLRSVDPERKLTEDQAKYEREEDDRRAGVLKNMIAALVSVDSSLPHEGYRPKPELTNALGDALNNSAHYIDNVGKKGEADAELAFSQSYGKAVIEMMNSRDYAETAWDKTEAQRMMNDATSKVQDETGKLKGEDREKVIESFNSWVDTFADRERLAYATSEDYLNLQMKKELDAVRFSAYYMRNPEQEKLEAQDIYGRTGRLMAPMPWETYHGYLYGDQQVAMPEAWKPGEPAPEKIHAPEFSKPELSGPEMKPLTTPQPAPDYMSKLNEYKKSTGDESNYYAYKAYEVTQNVINRDRQKAVELMQEQGWLDKDWKVGDALSEAQATVLFTATRDAYRDKEAHTFDAYRKYENVDEAAKAVYDPETGKSEIAADLAKTKKNEKWYAEGNEYARKLVGSIYRPGEQEEPAMRKIKKS
jgi:hypothetical protein